MKQKKGNLSVVQERILSALYLLRLSDMANGEGGEAFYNGSAIARVLGGAWSTYRRREITKMIASGCIEGMKAHVFSEVNYYRLKESSFEWCEKAYKPNPLQKMRLGQSSENDMQEELPF